MSNAFSPSTSIDLRVPLKDVFVTQPFGVNYAGFYKQLGMLGH